MSLFNVHPFAIACNFPRNTLTILLSTDKRKWKYTLKRHRKIVERKYMSLNWFSLRIHLGWKSKTATAASNINSITITTLNIMYDGIWKWEVSNGEKNQNQSSFFLLSIKKCVFSSNETPLLWKNFTLWAFLILLSFLSILAVNVQFYNRFIHLKVDFSSSNISKRPWIIAAKQCIWLQITLENPQQIFRNF